LILSENEDDEEREDREFSDSENEENLTRCKRLKAAHKQSKFGSPLKNLNFSSLPVIDNNGLGYLPKMQYFPVEMDCPLKPANQLKPEQAVNAIIHLPNGGFRCVALPLDGLDKDPNK
jgi:hypothetical protein